MLLLLLLNLLHYCYRVFSLAKNSSDMLVASNSQHKVDCRTMQAVNVWTTAMIQKHRINSSTVVEARKEGGGAGEKGAWQGGLEMTCTLAASLPLTTPPCSSFCCLSK